MCRHSTPANTVTAATAPRRNCSGFAPQTIDGLIQDLATAPIDSKLRPILAFVKKLTLTSTRMTQADADAVFAVGWDEAALHSAIAVCCLFNFMNRLVDGHGIEADRASFAERGRKHVEMGYVAQYEAAVAKNIRCPERGNPLGLFRAHPYH